MSPGTALPRIAVIGAGLVGGSIAAAVRQRGLGWVRLTDAAAHVRERARDLDLADEVTGTLAETVDGADLVIAAVPPAAVANVLDACAPHVGERTILTDAASLKLDLTLEVESRLRLKGGEQLAARFVAGHPMAGSERSGPEAADATLFQGATWILTPTASTDDSALSWLSGFLRGLGARVVSLSPQRHDELVAVVSHLPQVAASALASVAADTADAAGEVVLAIAGGGFRDTTRIAASEPDLWVGILRGNRTAALEALDRYRERLEAIRDALTSGDDAALHALLDRASQARRRMVPKVGDAALVDLVIALDDRPGALAAATTALGEAGINVEDVAMRHAQDARRGALVVRVAAEDVETAREVLGAHDLPAHAEGPVDATGES